MANVNGEWLDRPARAARIALVGERARKLQALARRGELTQSQTTALVADIAELKRLKRVHRAEVDMLYFFYEYFSEARNPGNPDNLVPTSAVDLPDAPDFHAKLSGILDSVSNRNKTARIAWAASRGHAKSAYLSNAFPVREIVFRKRRMILIISETGEGSKKFIKWVAGQLKYNEKLREDFGESLSPKRSQNEKDSEEAFLTETKIKMEATSLGKQIRGFRNGSQRPDLIILDDLESLDSNNTAELRQKNKNWFNQDLMPAGDPTRTAVIFMGTLLHFDSILNYVLRERHDFIKNSFPAIITEPKHSEHWAEFERIYREYRPTQDEIDAMMAEESTPGEVDVMSTPNARAAMQYYAAHRAEMDEGAKVLWPQRFPLPALIIEKVNIGSRAFNSEFMNNPIDEESQIFKAEHFSYFDSLDWNHADYKVYMGVDFAMGKERGDYSAIVTIAERRADGRVFVIDEYGERVHPSEFMQAIIERVQRFQPDRIAAEAQMAQEFFVDQLRDNLQRTGYPAHSRVTKIHQRSRKELRIEAMLPDIENGQIAFKRSLRLLIEQFERYGSRWHDDLPDALEMALSCAKKPKARIIDKPAWLY